MKRYLKIYFKLSQLSWDSLLIYRSNFFNSIISSLVWSFFSLLMIIFLTAKTSSVYGWTRDDLIVLIAGSNMVLGLFYFFFSINLHDFSQVVNLGKLDSILMKPLDTQFSISMWRASYQSLSRAFFGICIAVFMLSHEHAHIDFVHIIIFSILLVFSILLQYSIWFSVITLTIWFTTLSNLNDLLYNTNDFGRFPPEVFRGGKELLYFFVLPFTLINVVPVKTLLQKATITDVIWLLVVSLLFVYLSRKFFQFALRFYTSAN